MLVAYLERSEHPSMDQVAAAKIKMCDIYWATPAHPMDSVVFLIQHKKNFNGINAPFECGFSGHWKRKQKQIIALRKKFAKRILLSDVNIMKGKVLDAALFISVSCCSIC
ncbi:hypothetical protein Hanom_Chr05g00424781 [Helianthus anomalus]